MLPEIDLLLGGGSVMVTWTADALEELVIFYQDFYGHKGHSKSNLGSGSTDGNIQAYIAALQALSGCSINAYNRLIGFTAGSTAPAAVDPATGGTQVVVEAKLRMTANTVPGSIPLHITIFGPLMSKLIINSDGKWVPKLTDTAYATAMTASATALVETTQGNTGTLFTGGYLSVKHNPSG
jgi:hypothetical protein